MKRNLMPATTLAAVLMLVLFAPAIAFSQTQTSGALLAIDGTVTNGESVTPVHLQIYDSQIHTGVQLTVPTGAGSTCVASDQIPTDAYVLQGGSPTGCDPGDPFETSQGIGRANFSAGGSTFAIATQYLENDGENVSCTSEGVSPIICANPDTGFLTVTNSGNDFTGTITLSGTALNPNGISSSYCPTGGTVSDSFTGLLSGAGGAVTLALSTDSSNCGGFSQTQTQGLSAKGTITFTAGVDTWTVKGANNAGGEQITFLPFPTNQNLFVPGPLFAGATCNAVNDFSVSNNSASGPVCAPFLLSCSVGGVAGAGDCNTFASTVTTDCTGPAACGPNDGGFPEFLIAHGATSPPANGYDANIFFQYSPSSSPSKTSGGGGHTIFAPAYASTGGPQNSPVKLNGYASSFLGINNPPASNKWEEFVPIPLIWQEFDINNALVTNPKFFSGGFCNPKTPLASCPLNSVALQFVPANCSGFTPTGAAPVRAIGNAPVFNPFNNPFVNAKNTFNVVALPFRNFEGTCQILQLIVTGSSPGVQATYSAFFGPF